MENYTIHNEPDFVPVYETEGEVTIDKSVLRALLDLATGSMDFGSGFWDNEQVEVARKVAKILGIEPRTVTPTDFSCQYDGHVLYKDSKNKTHQAIADQDYYTNRCSVCHRTTKEN
jgi:hypothetical protein